MSKFTINCKCYGNGVYFTVCNASAYLIYDILRFAELHHALTDLMLKANEKQSRKQIINKLISANSEQLAGKREYILDDED